MGRFSQAVKVRCLGPGKEHSFWSANKSKYRICPRCKKKLDAMLLPGRVYPVHYPEER